MLDPYHTCWWTQHHTIDLFWKPPALRGAGVSLRILLEAFRNVDHVWYSRQYGDFDDDLILIAVDRHTAAQWTNIPYTERSPIAEAIRDDFDLEEYILTANILAHFDIALSDGTAHDSAEVASALSCLLDKADSRIYVKLSVHDDCFFFIDPVDSAVLNRLIAGVLQMHSYYLGRAIEWSNTSEYIIAQLIEKHRLQVIANVKRRQLELTEPNSDVSRFAHFLRPRRQQSIPIVGDRAIPPLAE